MASENWKNSPVDSCPNYPILSSCNINKIIRTNVEVLTSLIVGNVDDPESRNTSATSTIASGIGLTIAVPPVSGKDFIAYERSRFQIPGLPKTAYAASPGIGYTSLTPVLKIWTVSRNIAYFAFAIIFVVIGVMILIRSKIDPKTTMTIQNALPKIIMALVLVTFSYAIAGFLIDLMYVAMGLVITIASAIDPQAGDLATKTVNNNIFFSFFDGYTFGNIVFAGQAINKIVDSFLNIQHNTFIVGGVVNFVAGGLGFLIISVAILWALFKTWIMLLSAYANIILGIIFSPMQLMVDAIPGQSQFSGWLRTMLANLLAFPAVVIMIAIGLILSRLNASTGINPGFIPPLIGSNDMQSMQALIGIAIILTIPKTVEMLQEVLKSPKNKFGSAWGEALTYAWDKSPLRGARDEAYKGWYNKNIAPDVMRHQAIQEGQAKYEAGLGPVPVVRPGLPENVPLVKRVFPKG